MEPIKQTRAAARLAGRLAGGLASSRGAGRLAGGRGARGLAGRFAAHGLAQVRLQAGQTAVQAIEQIGAAARLATARLAGRGHDGRRLAAAAQPAGLCADRERRDDRDSQKDTTQHGTLLVRKNQRDTFYVGRLFIAFASSESQ
jgi:hypothetical protein